MKTKVILVFGLFTLLAAAAAYGQTLPSQAKIEFPFMVENKTLPAGTYTFAKDESGGVFHISDQAKNSANAQVLTRITTELRKMPNEPELVFDKMGETYVLAEVWLPGEDGYVIAMTKAKHEHKIVKMK